MLLGMDGYEILKNLLNKHKMGVIMVTAKEDITNKILGLELGADDYITKPFDMREAYIEGDQDSLTIILINLLDNAIKYNRANGSISVKTYVASDGTNQLAKVCIEVSDKLIL